MLEFQRHPAPRASSSSSEGSCREVNALGQSHEAAIKVLTSSLPLQTVVSRLSITPAITEPNKGKSEDAFVAFFFYGASVCELLGSLDWIFPHISKPITCFDVCNLALH